MPVPCAVRKQFDASPIFSRDRRGSDHLMRIVFFTTDLVFPSRVAGIAKQVNVPLDVVTSDEALLAKLSADTEPPLVVLLDLNCAWLTPAESCRNSNHFLACLRSSPLVRTSTRPNLQRHAKRGATLSSPAANSTRRWKPC